MSSGLSKLGTMRYGKGFHIGMVNQDTDHVTFTVQTSQRLGRIVANISGYNKWHHYAFVHDKNINSISLLIDGTVRGTADLLEFAVSREPYLYTPSYISFAGDYEMPNTPIHNLQIARIQMWRYPLSFDAIRRLFKTGN